jgi:membrane protease YdiL (CAAX protease family)
MRALAFYGLTLLLSWGWWGWLLLQGQTTGPGGTASHLPGLAGPMVAAMIVAAATGGLRDLLGRMVRVPLRPVDLALALVIPVAAAVISLRWLGDLPPLSDFLAYPGLIWTVPPIVGVVLVLVLNGFGEETGWRGFLGPELEHRFRPVWATLIVALAWAVWHLPLFWLHLPFRGMGPALIGGWFAGLLAGAYVLAWLYRKTGASLLAVALWHVVFNYCAGTPATEGVPAAVVSTIVILAGAIFALDWFRADPPPPGPEPAARG